VAGLLTGASALLVGKAVPGGLLQLVPWFRR
jgi:hypothetical protein